MGDILLLDEMSSSEIEALHHEFPHHSIITHHSLDTPSLGEVDWSQIEIAYTHQLTATQLNLAHQLRWIHSPEPSLSSLCIEEIRKRKNILVSNTKGLNVEKMGEYAMGVVAAFGKQLFHWWTVGENEKSFSTHPPQRPHWHLKGKIFLQIGLGMVGTEIARKARQNQFKVWGMKTQKSFHEQCHKTFSPDELHGILPAADIVSLSLPRGEKHGHWFKKTELELMKEDSILMVVGSGGVVDEDALAEVAKEGKFRGIALDTPLSTATKKSILKDVPNLLITPEIATQPRSETAWGYQIFRYNLRQYTRGSAMDMKNLITR